MLTINIGWEWALGIIGILILMAWNGSARFTALETSMEWVKATLNELRIALSDILSDRPGKSTTKRLPEGDIGGLRRLLEE
jgi:hypothetical protein